MSIQPSYDPVCLLYQLDGALVDGQAIESLVNDGLKFTLSQVTWRTLSQCIDTACKELVFTSDQRVIKKAVRTIYDLTLSNSALVKDLEGFRKKYPYLMELCADIQNCFDAAKTPPVSPKIKRDLAELDNLRHLENALYFERLLDLTRAFVRDVHMQEDEPFRQKLRQLHACVLEKGDLLKQVGAVQTAVLQAETAAVTPTTSQHELSSQRKLYMRYDTQFMNAASKVLQELLTSELKKSRKRRPKTVHNALRKIGFPKEINTKVLSEFWDKYFEKAPEYDIERFIEQHIANPEALEKELSTSNDVEGDIYRKVFKPLSFRSFTAIKPDA